MQLWGVKDKMGVEDEWFAGGDVNIIVDIAIDGGVPSWPVADLIRIIPILLRLGGFAKMVFMNVERRPGLWNTDRSLSLRSDVP